MIAKVPTLVATHAALGDGRPIPAVDAEPGHAANLLHMLHGGPPSPAETRVIDRAMTLQAEHGLAPSTLALRVALGVGTTVVAALGATAEVFAGPLHAGASGQRDGNPGHSVEPRGRRRTWPGGGAPAAAGRTGSATALYRGPDPRARLLRETALQLTEAGGDPGPLRQADLLVEAVTEEWGGALAPNVDCYTAAVIPAAAAPAGPGRRPLHLCQSRGLDGPRRRAARQQPSHPPQAALRRGRPPTGSFREQRLNLVRRIVDNARSHPESTALIVGGDVLEHGELFGMAAGLRDTIDEAGDRRGRVALLTSHSTELYVGVAAALLAGRSFMPIRAGDPEDRLLRMLRTADVTTIVCDEGTRELAAQLSRKLDPEPSIVLPQRGAARPIQDTAAPASGEVYLMHTSGSTGVPKGVPVSVRNLQSVLEWAEGHFEFTSEDRFAQTFEPTFDLWVFTTLAAWAAGAAVVDLPPADRFAPRDILERERVTVWFSTPTHARLIRQVRGLVPSGFPSLRWSLFCGEPLTMSDAVEWQQAAPNSRLENLYGPTEATLVCSSYRFPKPAVALGPDLGSWAPIGRVFPHLTHRVVDDEGAPVPAGEDGELWIAGPQVFDGYLSRPEETAIAPLPTWRTATATAFGSTAPETSSGPTPGGSSGSSGARTPRSKSWATGSSWESSKPTRWRARE